MGKPCRRSLRCGFEILLCTRGAAGVLLLAMAIAAGCADRAADEGRGQAGAREPGSRASGQIAVDGSSTVYPMTDLVARRYMKEEPRVWIRVDLSGSGRGIRKLIEKRVSIANASRRIKPSEIEAASAAGFGVIELPVAYDGIAVVVNPGNTWVDYMTTRELAALWRHGSTVETWSDLRADWPSLPVEPCAPTTESGTFACFTESICGEEGDIRDDYFAHEDEHILAPYVADNEGGIGFFGFAWYRKYEGRLRLVPIRAPGHTAPVTPSPSTIAGGQYVPLSRPLFIYVNAVAADRPEVDSFLRYYLDRSHAIAEEVGYVPLAETTRNGIVERYNARRTGRQPLQSIVRHVNGGR